MKFRNDMAKVVIKSEKLTPFGGIFSIMELFNGIWGSTIDCVLGQQTIDKKRISSIDAEFAQYEKNLDQWKKAHGEKQL